MGAELKRSRRVVMSPAWLARVKPEADPVEWRDSRGTGLVLRIEPSGTRTWVYRYTADVVNENGEKVRKARRFVLGRNLTIAAARKQYRKALKSDDPQAAREKAREADRKRKVGETVGQAVASWLADKERGPATGLGLDKPREWKGGEKGGTARSFLPHVKALARELKSVRVRDLAHERCKAFVTGKTKDATLAASTQNHRLAVVRAFVAWAQRKELLEVDPTLELRKQKERPRRRVLSDGELRTLLLGFDGTRYGRAVRLLALTACRRGEVLSAEWTWLDLDAGLMRVPPEQSKEGEARGDEKLVALSPQAVDVLEEQRKAQLAEGSRSVFVFATETGGRPHPDVLKPTLYRLKGRRANGLAASTDKRAKPRPALLASDVRVHDVRRTVADALVNRIGVLPWIVDKLVLAHYRSKDERAYMPTFGGKPLEISREALTQWAEVLDGILAAAPHEVKA